MYTTYDETGKMNNYANEPELYYAAQPSRGQKRNYLIQGAFAVLLVASLVLTSVAIS